VISPRSPWYGRLRVLAALLALVLANVAVLISYRGFADTRVAALEAERKELEAKRDAERQSLARLDESIKRLEALQQGLERFYTVTLGNRKDRLAPLIDEIHAITKKAGLAPDTIGYSEQQGAGGGTIHLNFRVTGTYPEIKKLLATFESSARFLVVDAITIGIDASGSDLLTIGFSLSHYFRESGPLGRGAPEAAARRGAAGAEEASARENLRVSGPSPAEPLVSAEEGAAAGPRAARTPAMTMAAEESAPAPSRGGGLLLPRVGTAPGVARAPRERAPRPAVPVEDAAPVEAAAPQEGPGESAAPRPGPGEMRRTMPRPVRPRSRSNEPAGIRIEESTDGGPGGR